MSTASNSATKSETTAGSPAVVISHPETGVAVLTLSRPRSRNALSRDVMAALHEAITSSAANPAVRAIVIAAEGPAFCAGHDLKELTAHRADGDRGANFFAETMTGCASLMQAIIQCPKPVIAAVHATATAAGCQLVATCDLAVASESAEFCTPGVNIGLFCSTPMVALSRNVGRKRAMEMLLLGDMLSAADAAHAGLINRVVPADRVNYEVLAMARKIASKPAATVAIGKRTFYDQIEMPLAAAYHHAAGVMVQNMLAPDAIEGIDAFIAKRAPQWPVK